MTIEEMSKRTLTQYSLSLLESPTDIERDKIKIVGRVMPLERSSEWTSRIAQRVWARV